MPWIAKSFCCIMVAGLFYVAGTIDEILYPYDTLSDVFFFASLVLWVVGFLHIFVNLTIESLGK